MDTPEHQPVDSQPNMQTPEPNPQASLTVESLQKQVHELQARFKEHANHVSRNANLWREHYFDLRKLFMGTLVALLILLPGLCWFLVKQVRVIRYQLEEQRPGILRSLSEFRTQGEPLLMKFTSRLQNFAATHPDFRPILESHRKALSHYFTTIQPTLPNLPTVPTNSPPSP